MKRQKGFTLIELIVVIMILGILATIAVPKFLKTSARAHDNATRQSLAVVRNAIELYTADNNGELPGQGASPDLGADLVDYLRGNFPISSPQGNADIAYEDAATLTVDGPEGWRYSQQTGEFIVNSSSALSSDPSIFYNQL